MAQTASHAPPVLSEAVGSVRILTLNRPDKLNAADLEMQQALLASLDAAGSDDETRAIVLTGAGRAFSAGGDRDLLRQIADDRLEQVEALACVHNGTIRCMLALTIPVIAAVPGPAVGYAAGLVAMCDIVVMGENAFLCDPHVHFGIAATTAVQLVWPLRTSDAFAREALMTGRRIPAHEALAAGLANHVCPAGEELQTAMGIAEGLAALPRAGIAGTKRAFNRPLLKQAERLMVPSG